MAGANYDIASNVLITVKANNDWTPSWTINNSDGTLKDLTGYGFSLVVRDGKGKTILSKADIDFTRTGTPPSTIGFHALVAEMNQLPGLYRYQLDAYYPDGTTRSWFEKPLLINENIGNNNLGPTVLVVSDDGSTMVTSDDGSKIQVNPQ